MRRNWKLQPLKASPLVLNETYKLFLFVNYYQFLQLVSKLSERWGEWESNLRFKMNSKFEYEVEYCEEYSIRGKIEISGRIIYQNLPGIPLLSSGKDNIANYCNWPILNFELNKTFIYFYYYIIITGHRDGRFYNSGWRMYIRETYRHQNVILHGVFFIIISFKSVN